MSIRPGYLITRCGVGGIIYTLRILVLESDVLCSQHKNLKLSWREIQVSMTQAQVLLKSYGYTVYVTP